RRRLQHDDRAEDVGLGGFHSVWLGSTGRNASFVPMARRNAESDGPGLFRTGRARPTRGHGDEPAVHCGNSLVLEWYVFIPAENRIGGNGRKATACLNESSIGSLMLYRKRDCTITTLSYRRARHSIV